MQLQKTPKINAGNVKEKREPRPADWLEIEVTFRADIRPEVPVIDSLQLKYYVVFTDPKTRAPAVAVGTVDHVNVVAGQDTNSVMYISPGSLMQLLQKTSGISERDLQAVAVEVYHGGQLVGGKASAKESDRWWQGRYPMVDGHLRPKSQTPFAALWSDYYAEEKLN
jgi:hypothetical protein